MVNNTVVETPVEKLVSNKVVPKGGIFGYSMSYQIQKVTPGYDSIVLVDELPGKVDYYGGLNVYLNGSQTALPASQLTIVSTESFGCLVSSCCAS